MDSANIPEPVIAPANDQRDPPDAHTSTTSGDGSPAKDKPHELDDEQANAWHKQSQPYKIPKPKRRGKRRAESLPAALCQWIVDHQIGESIL